MEGEYVAEGDGEEILDWDLMPGRCYLFGTSLGAGALPLLRGVKEKRR